MKAKLLGAKIVPAVVLSFAISSARPVFRRASSRVEKSPGRYSITFRAEGGGMMKSSTAWMTPLVANYTL